MYFVVVVLVGNYVVDWLYLGYWCVVVGGKGKVGGGGGDGKFYGGGFCVIVCRV